MQRISVRKFLRSLRHGVAKRIDGVDDCFMTKENLQRAIDANVPFTISMADGKEYDVPHRDFIAFTRKQTAAVVTTDDYFHVLPLLTMTGLHQQVVADTE